jgi:multidrug resistance efflux pump
MDPVLAMGTQTTRPDSPVYKGGPLEDASGPPDAENPCLSPRFPKLRDDLIISQLSAAAGAAFVIKDPANGQFFRFKEPEHFIARQLDGATPPEVVCQRVEEEFGATLGPEALTDFVKTLDHNRLLETAEVKAKRRDRRHRRIRGNVFYVMFQVCDPDRLLDRLVTKVRFCFTPYFIILSALLILSAFWVLAFNWGAFTGDLSRLYHLGAIPMIWLIILLVTTAHEFAHGLTCKHFGGRVHEMGFLLLLLQPCMYCNVSDAWLFPEKTKRLWVSFAGPYFELFLWALAVLTWRLTDPDTSLNILAMAVAATSGIKTLLNFNPLLKMDGYYLLSDAIGVHNLRRRSYAYIGAGLKRLFGVKSPVDGTPGERRIFLLYGLIASAFSFCFLGYMVAHLANFLLERNQGLPALLILLFLIVGKIRRRLLRLFPRESKSFFKALKKSYVAMRRPAIAFALLAAVSAFVFLVRMELKVSGPFRVMPLHNADVRAEVEGIVEQLAVDEGDRVQESDQIARLSDRDNAAELLKTEADIDAARAKLRLLEAGARPEEVDVAKAAVARAEDSLRYAQSRLARDKALFEQDLLARKDFETTQEQSATAESDLAEARSKLEVLLAGSRPEDIDATKAEIARLQTQRGYLQEQVRLTRVLSPASGIVATPSRQLKEMAHQLVKKGDLIAKVYEMDKIEAETPVSEKEIADVKAGQIVALKVRAYPDMTFYGRVTSISTATIQSGSAPKEAAPVSAEEFSGKSIRVTTRIDNTSLLLKPGMTGNAKILCGQRRVIDLITRRIARTFKVEFWSWW